MKLNFVFLAALAYVVVAVPIEDVVDIEARGPPSFGPGRAGISSLPPPPTKGNPTLVTPDHSSSPLRHGPRHPERVKRRELDWDDIEARGPPRGHGPEQVGTHPTRPQQSNPTVVNPYTPSPQHSLNPPSRIKRRELD